MFFLGRLSAPLFRETLVWMPTWSSRTTSLFFLLCFSLLLLFFSRVSDAAPTPLSGGDPILRYPSTTHVTSTRPLFSGLLQRSPEVAASGFYELMQRDIKYAAGALRTITPAKIASLSKVVAKRLGPAGLAISLIDLVWDPVDEIWKKPDDSSDPLIGCWTGRVAQYCYTSPTSACQSRPLSSPYYFHSVTGSPPTMACISAWPCNCVNGVCSQTCTGQYSTTSRFLTCSPGTVPDPGTKTCVSSETLVPASDSEVENSILDGLLSSPVGDKPKQQVQRLIDLEGLENILPHFDPVSEVSGPEEFQSHTETTTKTTTEGTETTTVKNEYPINYIQPKTINVTNKRTTTVNKPNGETVITVEIFTSDSGGGSSNSPWPAFCDWAKVVCDFIDWVKSPPELPTDPELPTQSLTSKDWVSGLGNGTCPSPISISLIDNKAMQFKFDEACYVASNIIHPILLMMAYLSAAVILVGMRRAD